MIEDFEVLQNCAYSRCHDRSVQRPFRSDRSTWNLGIARTSGPSGDASDCSFHDYPSRGPFIRPPACTFAGAVLLAIPLPSKSANIFRAREAGTRAFMMRFRWPGTTLERFLIRPLRDRKST